MDNESGTFESSIPLHHKADAALPDESNAPLPENELLLREAAKLVEALGKTIAPLGEVVLHDLSKPDQSIVKIVNNLSGRRIGDGATNYGRARIANPDFPDILQNYSNQFPDGRIAKSTSIGLKNSKGEYVCTICINIDISILSSITAILGQLSSIEQLWMAEKETFPSTSFASVYEEIKTYAAAHNTTPRALTVKQRREVMQVLAKKGLLDLKHAQRIVADAFGVARSTIYSYMQKDRS